MNPTTFFFDWEQFALFFGPLCFAFGCGYWLCWYMQRKLAASSQAMYESALTYMKTGDKFRADAKQLHGEMEKLLERWRRLTNTPPRDPDQTMRGPAGQQ